MEIFRARYDGLHMAVTLVFAAGFLGVGLIVWLDPNVPQRFRLYFAILPFAVLLFAYLYSPRGFSVGPDGLRIHRPRSAILIPLPSIRSAQRASPRDLCGIRTFGSGGLFGTYGWFYARRFGHYRAYVTCRRDLVLVQAERVYLLSPERPDDFLCALAQWVPGLATTKP